MKAVVITCFESNEERVTFVMDALKTKGYEVSGISTNFSHFNKKYRDEYPEGIIGLKTERYNKNLSIKRLVSHNQFSLNAFFAIDEIKPDLIWLIAPCNSLIKRANKYKKKHPNVKLIIDIIDMWPESFPKYEKGNFFFEKWKEYRSKNINSADELVCECDLYQEILKNEYNGKITTIHWSKDGQAIENEVVTNDDKLSLAYIGSINNIIDIDLISDIISVLDRKVELHVIGDGEKLDYMKSKLSKVANVNCYGKVYDINEKRNIFSKCHAGINIYKEGLYIGLTVKCIDYFRYGLPIINNIKGDTWNFVENNNVGINVERNSVLDSDKLINMRKNNSNIYDFYNNNFTKEVFVNKCLEVIDRVTK